MDRKKVDKGGRAKRIGRWMKVGDGTELGKLAEAMLRRDLEDGGVRRSCTWREEVYLERKG